MLFVLFEYFIHSFQPLIPGNLLFNKLAKRIFFRTIQSKFTHSFIHTFDLIFSLRPSNRIRNSARIFQHVEWKTSTRFSRQALFLYNICAKSRLKKLHHLRWFRDQQDLAYFSHEVSDFLVENFSPCYRKLISATRETKSEVFSLNFSKRIHSTLV